MSVTVQKPSHSMVLRPQSFDELWRFSQMAAASKMVPKDYIGQPESIMLAVQMGSEVGLAPMQALQNISVINGRPSLWGDAMLALCKASDVCEDIIETVSGEGQKMVARCIAKRIGKTPVDVSFSYEDAKIAGLTGKQGPWTQYPRRMLQMRARGFALRDAFPDVLKGLISAEEAQDLPAQPFTGHTIEVAAEPIREATKRTARQFLSDLKAELDAATDRDAVCAIMAREDVQSAFSKLKGAALDELETVTQEADLRFPPTDIDDEKGSGQ